MGLWGNLASLSGLGPDDPGSKSPVFRSFIMLTGAVKVRAAPFDLKMAKTKVEKLGSAKRFGSRYGSKPKHKFAKIEKEQRKKHRCPYCNALKVKRIAVGIWHCRKCNAKFTGKAYSVAKLAGVEEIRVEDEKNLERLPKANLEESSSPQGEANLEEMPDFGKKQKLFDKVQSEKPELNKTEEAV